ncbi:MAG: ADP-ribosylglycohydrolase family protein [Acidobacteriota bacterium]|nr:ADP-ribosylglycohydrolase family protein [Acidobacteriota bacterium]
MNLPFESSGRLLPVLAEPSVGDDRVRAIERSALWAAYGDALGWISELTGARGLRQRTGGVELEVPIPWKRRIGGRSGVAIDLPAGTYSDDSQLRLATGRAIRAQGFDVEAFAKIELPTWLGYALGAGRSTKAAAQNLAKPRVPWYGNTYRGWIQAGGNGAAMRVQPHVWAAHDLSDHRTFLPDVVRNAICTHSHPTGIMGAVLHALVLALAMTARRLPSAEDVLHSLEVSEEVPDLVAAEPTGTGMWRHAYEHHAGSFEKAWSREVEHARSNVVAASQAGLGTTGKERYDAIVGQLGLRDPRRRGSGTLTAIAAAGLLWCEPDPAKALSVAANCLDTDTDTIGTMAGALVGVVSDSEPPRGVQDSSLFHLEAERLGRIARGERPTGHPYPDLDHWSAPRVAADVLSQDEDGRCYMGGLGRVELQAEPKFTADGRFAWQWGHTDNGQTLLLKRRQTIPIRSGQLPQPTVNDGPKTAESVASETAGVVQEHSGGHNAHAVQRDSSLSLRRSISSDPPLPDLHRAIEWVRQNRQDDATLGRAMRSMVRRGSTEQILRFVAALVRMIGPGSASQGRRDPDRDRRHSGRA